MSSLGLWMFAVALALMVLTGLPVYAVLLATSSAFAALGCALGAFDLRLLGAVSSRVVGLLEHDLLQALPLFALSGALLNQLPLARLLHRAAERLFQRSTCATELAALTVGALLAPMNGSVGASLHSLSRSVAPAMLERGVAPNRMAATVCVASTLGVVIPPSLVLLLLGDAMMRAHTEAVNVTHAAVRIVNTQDVMRAVWLPGLIVLLMALALTAWRGRSSDAKPVPKPMPKSMPNGLSGCDAVMAAAVVAVILLLLVGVATGRFFAVEAAATGCVLLAVGASVSGRLPWRQWKRVLSDAMNLTGALMALLVGATAFSLVLRAFDTDALIARQLQILSAQPAVLLAVVLGGMLLCSFVLDAFEMIFLVVPLVMPPVLMVVPDAAWMAALTLLVLQLGFLLPPFGYALVMSRQVLPQADGAHRVGLHDLSKALWPQLLAQACLIAAVLFLPQITQWTRPVEPVRPGPTNTDSGDADKRMQEAVDAQMRESSTP